jgi:hypothetical protein
MRRRHVLLMGGVLCVLLAALAVASDAGQPQMILRSTSGAHQLPRSQPPTLSPDATLLPGLLPGYP